MERYMRAHLAENTKKAYGTAVRAFRKYLAENEPGRAPFPASDGMLGRFLSTLADEGKCYGTIMNYKYGVDAAQRERGYRVRPMEDRLRLRFTLRGIKRTIGDQPRPKFAVTLSVLRKFERLLPQLRADKKNKVLWGAAWAAILVGFYGMLRKDNLTAGKRSPEVDGCQKGLKWDDICFAEAKGSRPAAVWLRLRYSKTNQFREAPHVLPLAATGGSLCPLTALLRHRAETSKEGGPLSTDAVFRVPGRGRSLRPLTHAELVKAIKDLARAAGFDPKKYAGHSLRRGGATLAFQLGATASQVKTQGCWKSDCYLRYNQMSAADRLALPTRMAQAAIARG